MHRDGVRLLHHHPIGEADLQLGLTVRLPPHLRPVAVVSCFHGDGDSDARDAACDGRLRSPEGNLDYRHPRSGWTHAMPHMPTRLNPRGRVHRCGVRLPHHHPAGRG